MSQAALITATVAFLRERLGLDADTCAESDEGKPLPMSGEVFYGVHDGPWTADNFECLREYFGVSVTVTVRAGQVPFDRTGPELLSKAKAGITDRCLEVRAAMHSNYADVMNKANVALGTLVNGFVEPLRFLDGGRRARRGPDWFAATGQKAAGYSQTLTFGKAMRVQTIESQA